MWGSVQEFRSRIPIPNPKNLNLYPESRSLIPKSVISIPNPDPESRNLKFQSRIPIPNPEIWNFNPESRSRIPKSQISIPNPDPESRNLKFQSRIPIPIPNFGSGIGIWSGSSGFQSRMPTSDNKNVLKFDCLVYFNRNFYESKYL